jgi:GPH family glycoside/pentoside/hexuronide:cation symporter
MMKKLKKSEMFSYAASATGGNLLLNLIAFFLTSYYTDTVGIAAAAVGTMMLVLRVFDGITDLIMGGIIDKTHSKYGKAKIWVMISIPLMWVAAFLLLNTPLSFSDGGKLLYAYITYFFMSCIVMTIYQVSDNALLSRISLDPQERQTTSSITQVITGIAQLCVTSFTAAMVAAWGWRIVSIIYATVAAVVVLIGILGVHEHVDENQETKQIKVAEVPMKQGIKSVLHNRYFINLAVIFIFQQIIAANSGSSMVYYCRVVLGNMGGMTVLGMAAAIPQILINFVLPFLVKRFSKQKCQIGGAILLIIGFTMCGAADTNFSIAVIGTCIRAAAMGIFFACSYAFSADVVDYGEYKSGIRADGLVNSGVSFGLKVGVGFGSAMVAWILAAGGYVGTAEVQTASAVTAVKWAFGYANAVAAACLLIACCFMNVEKYHEEVRKALDERHANDSAK